MEYINDEYVLTNRISDQNMKEMRTNMDASDIEEFDNFANRVWGKKEPVNAIAHNGNGEEKRRGRPKNRRFLND